MSRCGSGQAELERHGGQRSAGTVRLRGRSTQAFDLAYLHIIEPRVKGNILVAEGQAPVAAEELRTIFKGKIIAAGGFEPGTAEAVVATGDADLVTFGRYFVSNPDLPRRIELGLPLTPYDRNTFYTFDARGYTDYYPFYEGRAAA